jgi:hypothetical protein
LAEGTTGKPSNANALEPSPWVIEQDRLEPAEGKIGSAVEPARHA